MAKNTMGKTRPVERPYEVWRYCNWEWHVLKYWQADGAATTKPYARAFCAVYSPITREQMSGGYEMGDVYVDEIRHLARLIKTDYDPPKEA